MENEKIIKQMRVNDEYFEIVDEQARNEIEKLKRYEIPAEWNEEHLIEAIRVANDGGAVFYSPENTYQLSLDSFKSYIDKLGHNRFIVREMKFIDFIKKKLVYTFKTTGKDGKNWELTTEDVPNSSGLVGVNLEWKKVGNGRGDTSGCRIMLDNKLENGKNYMVAGISHNYNDDIHFVFSTCNKFEDNVYSCHFTVLIPNTDENLSLCEGYVDYDEDEDIFYIIFSSLDEFEPDLVEEDTFEVYEQVIVNVVNPDNTKEVQEKLVAGDNIKIEGNVISATGGSDIDTSSFVKNVALNVGGGPDNFLKGALDYFFENRTNEYSMNFIVNNDYHCYIDYAGSGFTCKLVSLEYMTIYYNSNPVNEGFTYDDMGFKEEPLGGGKTYYNHKIDFIEPEDRIIYYSFNLTSSNNIPFTFETLNNYLKNNIGHLTGCYLMREGYNVCESHLHIEFPEDNVDMSLEYRYVDMESDEVSFWKLSYEEIISQYDIVDTITEL